MSLPIAFGIFNQLRRQERIRPLLARRGSEIRTFTLAAAHADTAPVTRALSPLAHVLPERVQNQWTAAGSMCRSQRREQTAIRPTLNMSEFIATALTSSDRSLKEDVSSN
ncbi:hypothetical protein [Cupriavidus sp. UYPR2.512]|uniref:hypothetical protein n=1 Tax=Cupriavidus sp. UYPR2.512 TaxID=1080187 RepID=UPI0012FA7D7F|nr:hypothetical protein [Cupriavidus sp. UYPR2.512]UIF87891.1 hypothetical protein KAF44_21350 [Cupriavidus necator]